MCTHAILTLHSLSLQKGWSGSDVIYLELLYDVDLFRSIARKIKASSHPLIPWQQSLCTLPHPNKRVFAQFLSLLLNHIFYLHFLFLSIIIICQKRARELQQKDILYTVIKQAKNLSRIKGNDCSVLETTTVQNLVWTTLYLGTYNTCHCSFPPGCPKK